MLFCNGVCRITTARIRITSYNVCYTKLLRPPGNAAEVFLDVDEIACAKTPHAAKQNAGQGIAEKGRRTQGNHGTEQDPQETQDLPPQSFADRQQDNQEKDGDHGCRHHQRLTLDRNNFV